MVTRCWTNSWVAGYLWRHEAHVTSLRRVSAGCAIMRPWQAVVIGAVGGLVAVLGIPMFEKLKIDDPVGALSVHGLCGIWVSCDRSVTSFIYWSFTNFALGDVTVISNVFIAKHVLIIDMTCIHSKIAVGWMSYERNARLLDPYWFR